MHLIIIIIVICESFCEKKISSLGFSGTAADVACLLDGIADGDCLMPASRTLDFDLNSIKVAGVNQ